MTKEHKHKFACVMLAAGKGLRMQSEIPKVMHLLAGKPLIGYVVSAFKSVSPEKMVVVLAPHFEEVEKAAKAECETCEFAIQDKQQGTGDAVAAAETALKGYNGTIVIACGDAPLITGKTIEKMLDAAQSADIVVAGMRMEDPTGYGRLLVDTKGQLQKIIEERDATPEQRENNLCNSGLMAVNSHYLFKLLKNLTTNNALGEYYLTDIIAEADAQRLHCKVVEAPPAELLGINTRVDLAEAEMIVQMRLRRRALE